MVRLGLLALLSLAACQTHKVSQIYYLGVFDADEQVPEAVYRVQVKGQASPISATRFASGWVPAELVDSLASEISLKKDDPRVKIAAAAETEKAKIKTGRRLIAFGPEGFREAPRDHRLVIVMGSSPEDFFKAIDQSLRVFATVKAEKRAEGLRAAIFEALVVTREENRRLEQVERDVLLELPAEGGGR